MKVYGLFYNTTDGCTYNNESLMRLFKDKGIADVICEELNKGINNDYYDFEVKEVEVKDYGLIEDVEKEIAIIKKEVE